MKFYQYPSLAEAAKLIERPIFSQESIFEQVQPILSQVKANGDAALFEFAKKFENQTPEGFEISTAEIEMAESLLSPELKEAIQLAYQNIRTFHAAQKQPVEVIETMPGVKCWRKSVPIQKIGIYIPGGTAPLFSTVLMLGVPAQLAGCQEIILCSPSNHPAIYYAAKLVGVTKIFRVGGAQAIAAMAYGTETIPKVYKIFGPGNQYVTAAKTLVSAEGIAIDMPAGPSEVAVLADDTALTSFVAADLLSQAEHGADSQVVLVTTSQRIFDEIEEEVNKQLDLLPRKELAAEALKNSSVALVRSVEEGMQLLNDYAPEHLILAVENPEMVAEMAINAGSIFLGHYTPESCGDYASGTNHTLPTNGFARAYSGVSLDSFVKKITMQSISVEGLKNIGNAVELMAEAEGLDAHKKAVTVRLRRL